MVKNVEPAELTSQVQAKIDHWVAKYPSEHKRSAVLPALLIVQEEQGNGHLSAPLIAAVADYLEMPHMAAEEVVSFYSMYERKPVGRHKINVCTNISCKLKGSDQLVDHLNKRLGVGLGETTEDKRFTLKQVECLGACIGAPVCQINKDYHENLSPEKLDEILDGLE